MVLKGCGLILFFVFLISSFVLWHSRDFVARRRLTGYEVARYLLDQVGLTHISIQVGGVGEKTRVNHFLLEPRFRESRILFDFSRISQQVVIAVKASSSGLFACCRAFWPLADFLIPVAWVCLLLTIPNPSWLLLRVVSLGILVFTEMVALCELADMVSVNRKAFLLLKESGFFEIDELIRMRKILRALRWESLIRIFKAPCDLAVAMIAGRKMY